MLVAIDGPAGAGKSTVARAVAAALGFTYLDTGAMYRCVGLLSDRGIRRGAPGEIAGGLRIELGERVVLDDEDVTAAIRTPEVSAAASEVAADPSVREAMVGRQRELIGRGDWVAEGRDIATVVAPDAEVKVFLTASDEVRAERRAGELGVDVGGGPGRPARARRRATGSGPIRRSSPRRTPSSSTRADSDSTPLSSGSSGSRGPRRPALRSRRRSY